MRAAHHAAETARVQSHPQAWLGVIVKRTDCVFPFTAAGQLQALPGVVCSGVR